LTAKINSLPDQNQSGNILRALMNFVSESSSLGVELKRIPSSNLQFIRWLREMEYFFYTQYANNEM